MIFSQGGTLLNLALILVGLAIGWMILKTLLRFTFRIFATGCMILLALVALAALLGMIG